MSASLDDAVRHSQAVDDLGGVLGLDGFLRADCHEVRCLRVIDRVHVVFLFDAPAESRFLCGRC